MESFESFGSTGVDEGIIVMNPGEYTLMPEDMEQPLIQKSRPEKVDLEEQAQIEKKIEKQLTLAYRDPKQKRRIDKLKARGIYKNR